MTTLRAGCRIASPCCGLLVSALFLQTGAAPGARTGVAQESEKLTDGPLTARCFAKREMMLDRVAVPPPVALLHDVTGVGEVADDAICAAFGDIESCGE